MEIWGKLLVIKVQLLTTEWIHFCETLSAASQRWVGFLINTFTTDFFFVRSYVERITETYVGTIAAPKTLIFNWSKTVSHFFQNFELLIDRLSHASSTSEDNRREIYINSIQSFWIKTLLFLSSLDLVKFCVKQFNAFVAKKNCWTEGWTMFFFTPILVGYETWRIPIRSVSTG